MSILDSILGGNSGGGNSVQDSSSSHNLGSVIGTDPAFGTSVNDLLHLSHSDSGGGFSDTSGFTGLGSLGLGFSAPTVVGVSSTNDSSNASESHGGSGGLLNGLL